MCCGKVILFTTNAIIFVLGVVVVGIASATIHKGSDYGELLSQGIVTLPILILILGLVICIISFLGWFGTLKESKCMLYTYAGIVLVAFLGEIVVAILLIAHPEITSNALDKFLRKQFDNYYGTDEALTKSIDNMQQDLECCGVDGPSYWPKGEVPWSCCSGGNVESITCNKETAYDQGCEQAFIDEYKSITLALGITGIVLALFLIFSMFTACGLARKHNH